MVSPEKACLALLLATAVSAAEPFDYFTNSWQVIGLKDYAAGTRVTPDSRLLLGGGRLLRLRVGPELVPLGRGAVKTLLEGWLPVVQLHTEAGTVRYDVLLWATPVPSVKDWQEAFDGPAEGENYLNWVLVRATNRGPRAAVARLAVDAPREAGALTGRWSPSDTISPGRSAELVVRVPFEPVADARGLGSDADVWLRRTADWWRGLLDSAGRIEVPDRKAEDTLRAAHVCQLLAADHGEVHGGEGFYDEFYVRDGAYQLLELEEAGLDDAARRMADCFLRYQRPDGRFESQGGQFDANGQALWAIQHYHAMTGDRAWLERAVPAMLRACDWIRATRRQAAPDSPFAGLLPAAVADGESLWDGKHHIVGYDIWNLRGLFCTADAAHALGLVQQAEALEAEAAAFQRDIGAAVERSGLHYFPPSWEKEGTPWGNTELLWPTLLFDRQDPRVTALLKHVRTELGGGFHEGTIRWMGTEGAIHPYLSAYNTMDSLARDEDETVVREFYWYLLHSSASHAFPEGIFYRRRFAWSDTIPHGTGAANYAILLRHMLVEERGAELHLLPAVPDGWLVAGQRIRLTRLPTTFGHVDLEVRGERSGVRVHLTAPDRVKPAKVVLHLPQSRTLLDPPAGIEVVSRPDQAVRWSFDRVVAEYLAAAPQPVKIDLVSLPRRPAVDGSACELVDLRAAAVTDPFEAPFGVPRPGKYLFTGLQVGRQVIAGVPFEVLDPAGNQGRGLVVLHAPQAPQSIAWPKEVRIPVGRTGRRLYFLGNVTGWAPGDPGAGPHDAVAEYEIVYADGVKQIVPLVSGRTADDWASPPEATDVTLGLRGDPWHLNVLGVPLRPVAVVEVVFRDLDTPAAPLLAAVTLER
ncbi:MAG: hypothetical protein HYU66_22625 [Armatimonadetes bacterium]|nr:hypothetical protein [Armatimonadota bacterium]